MILLAFETSCDETSVAVIQDGEVRANVVASQVQLHSEYGGVVPELAAREHLRNLPGLTRVALGQAAVSTDQLDAVAATQGPGLPHALMVGLKAAQGLAFALERPFIGIHHHEAHLYSPWIRGSPLRGVFADFQPNIALIVSGGHTLLVQVSDLLRHQVLGATLDDAAGECFDKTAKLLGLPYPGGPELDRLASEGDPRAFAFPRPLLGEPGNDFSFSGLKTAVRYFLRDHPEASKHPQTLRDLCASIQSAIVDVLVTKTMRAARHASVSCLTVSGGVTCNRALRHELGKVCAQRGLDLRLAEPALCTDNAAMVGVLATLKLERAAARTAPDAEIRPQWPLDELGLTSA